MSDPNLKAMTQAELFKYLEEDFMPRLLPKLANVRNIEAENAHLKAEVEAYRSASDEVAAAFLALPAPHNQVARVCEGIESLKAEVERLRASSFVTAVPVECIERLEKAGDAMADALSPYRVRPLPIPYLCDLQKDWEFAKEGKPSV